MLHLYLSEVYSVVTLLVVAKFLHELGRVTILYTRIIIFNIVITTRNKQLCKEMGAPGSLSYSADSVMQN